MSIKAAKAELKRWTETGDRLLEQLDAARATLGEEQDRRSALVLPARTGDGDAKKRLAEHDERIKSLRKDIGELAQAADDAESRRKEAEARLADLEQAELDREVAAIESEAAAAAARVDAGLETVAAAVHETEKLIGQAARLRGRSLERPPVDEALRRALAFNRIGSVHAVHRALLQSFSRALRLEASGGGGK